MAGLVTPSRAASIISKLKANLKVPVDFHTHCTPGYGLASSVMAIINGVDILDTNIWWFGGGSAAPAIELVYLFAKKLGVEIDVDMKAVGEIRKRLLDARKSLKDFDLGKLPRDFDPLNDKLPAEIEAQLDAAVAAAKAGNEAALLDACHAIEDYFGFPKPNELVKNADMPGGMYSNMVAQLEGPQGRRPSRRRHAPDSYGSPRRRSCASGYTYKPDCRQPGRLCRSRPPQRQSRLYDQVKPVYFARQGRIRSHACRHRPRLPRENHRQSGRETL